MTSIDSNAVKGLIRCFENLKDPRSHINRHHLLVDVIVISICGVVAGADGPVAIEVWAKSQAEWLQQYLQLPHGIPSHDTIGRVLEHCSHQLSRSVLLLGWYRWETSRPKV